MENITGRSKGEDSSMGCKGLILRWSPHLEEYNQ
jgi:hypothetical protein